jgi:hypothetical protein
VILIYEVSSFVSLWVHGLCHILCDSVHWPWICAQGFECVVYRVTTFRRRFCGTHLSERNVNVIGGSYTHVHTLPRPKWHKTKYTNFMAMNKQREMRFI